MGEEEVRGSTVTRDAETRGAPPGFRVVLVIARPEETQAVELEAGRPRTLGRGETADVRISDPSLSRVHATFELSADAVTVTDLGSHNGTVVRGERVQRATLRAGETAVLGNVTVSPQWVPSSRAALLGLASYEAMVQSLHEEWLRAQGTRRAFSLVMLRPAGSALVGDYAQPCVDGLEPAARAGLYNPQSLLVLLPGAEGDAAAARARSWVALAGTRVRLVGGVAAYPQAGATPAQLLTAVVDAARAAADGGPIAVAPSLAPVASAPAGERVRTSAKMKEIERLVQRAAAGRIPVLVLGETGTGKELIARDLHAQSPRRAGPFKIVNCAALPENLVESVLFGHEKGAFTGADRTKTGVLQDARGGTVLFDEIGELPASAQAALLRALDSGRVTPVGSSDEVVLDVRVVAATHRDLAAMVERGAFRLDLLHRLNAFTLHLPPLRERPEEIAPLAAAFVARLAGHYGGGVLGVAPDALEAMERYRWPGNVRELRNVIERALTLATGDWISLADLPDHVARPAHALAASGTLPPVPGGPVAPASVDLRFSLDDHEARLIVQALEKTGGHRARAAQLLGIPLRTFERKLQKLGSSRRDG